MRVMVAGGSGVLGSRVAQALVHAGHDVYGTTRGREKLAIVENTGARGLIMDALDPASVAQALDGASFDVIVHELTNLAEFDFAGNARLRIEGTANLVDAALARGVRSMVAQSISWAYRPGSEPAAEDEPFARPNSEPAFGSVEELEASVARMPYGVVLRYGLLYGPGTWYDTDGALTRAAREGTVDASTAWTSFVHVDDAVAATVQALTWPSGPVNVVDDDPVHVDEWGPLFARACGYAAAPRVSARSAGRAADNTLARSRGWTPEHPTWRTTLAGQD
ncbi:MAG: NAD-dependent epimerase/dehydratase family protein [Streptosporangiales bacterium]|nr:NAD-dependent epimerase/dehydratase family protein [Streptosporangiales bacterium]